MIEIKFPADRPDVARALARALAEIGGQTIVEASNPAALRGTGSTPVAFPDEPDNFNDGPGHEDGPEFDGYAERAGETTHPKGESLFDGSVGTAEAAAEVGAGEQTTPPADSPAAASTRQAPTDTKGVPFNAEYCGQAKEPFYGSGKRSGQWKKRKGVEDAAYDEWYAGELAKLQASPASQTQAEVGEDDHQPEPVNSAAAFGSAQQAPANAPQNTGEFMGWVSEKQAAGLLTQDQIQAAYTQAGVQVTDLFPPTDAATVAQRIGQLYGILSATAGA